MGGEHSTIELLCHSAMVQIDLDTATGLGLAVSELIANGYMHAFPAGHGTINVSVEEKDRDCVVTVSDDGVGFVEPTVDKLHGINLVNRLMEQICGSAHPSFRPRHEMDFAISAWGSE